MATPTPPKYSLNPIKLSVGKKIYTVKHKVTVSLNEYIAKIPWLIIAKTIRNVLNDFGSDEESNNKPYGAKVWAQQKLIV